MRRLSMKSKRGKSELSETESEENGVARNVISDGEEEMKKNKEAEDGESPRKASPKKRQSRSRNSQKATLDESTEDQKSEESETQAGKSDEEENGNVGKGGTSKRRKKEDQKASTSIKDKTNNEKEYEVEKIVGQRTIKGRRQFLIRWKGYNEDSDTWEQEKDLNCAKLIEQYLINMAEEEEEEEEESQYASEPEKSGKQTRSKPAKVEKTSKKPKNSPKKQTNDKAIAATDNAKGEKNDQKEFEVEKIIEVRFKKNKTREFLIRWKGFTSADDTWEPEGNLNCPDLILKFMQKVEKAKTADFRELRTNPAHTKRYTLTTHEYGRRLSRRNMDKQRAMYHECDE